ncbi:helix-turn-helix domain-containing protein [Amycolatopsis sulphurea]|uniref:helix-turn-helix domain-containing protein n=1 Tax=Amycolatopsis sulphurea TaxID=76022 RepID=UPI000BFA78F5|nr:helix-turn-helix domain-containing protein [Amycolatopsis sulphurea]
MDAVSARTTRHFAHRVRGREVGFTPAAARAPAAFDWPENVKQLRRVVREAAARSEVIDVPHLPADVFTNAGHRLSRLQAMERDEIVRCLAQPGATVVAAAAELGMARATIYRKMTQCGIKARQLRS